MSDDEQPVDLNARRRGSSPPPDPESEPGGGDVDEDDRAAALDAALAEDRKQHEREVARVRAWADMQGEPFGVRVRESRRQHREVFGENGWPGLIDHYLDGGRAWWEIGAAVLAVLLTVAAALGLVGGVALGLLAGTVGVGAAAVDGLGQLGVLQTIYDPVMVYLDGHAAGLPMTAEALAGTWLATEIALLVWACCGSWGARVGWTLTGALTVAMVWAGTVPHGSRWTAAGVAVVVWSVLSIAAFRGAFRRPRVVVLPVRKDDS